MKARPIVDAKLAMAGGAIALVTAVWMFGLLIVIARPKSVSEGLPRAQRRMDRIEAVLATPGDPYAYNTGALCLGWPATAAPAVRETLNALAAARGVTLSGAAIDPGSAGADALTPVAVRFQVEGGYGAVLGFMDALAKARPQIFLDTADLRSNLASVSLTVNGRLYCSTYARP